MRKAFTLVEIMIVVAIVALLAAIAIPNFLAAKCKAQCESGECSDTCRKMLDNKIRVGIVVNKNRTNAVLAEYDRGDVEVFCNLLGVSTNDFEKSESLRNYYEEFKKGTLDLGSVKR